MRSALQRRRQTPEGAAALNQFQACSTWEEKRNFYWNSWIEANAKQENRSTKTHSSESKDASKQTDHGWVDRAYVAKELGLDNYHSVPEQMRKLTYKLSQLDSRPHPGAQYLEEGDDPYEYHLLTFKRNKEEANKERLELSATQSLEDTEYQGAMSAVSNITAAGNGSLQQRGGRQSRTGLGAGGQRRTPAEDKPEWLKAFDKEGPNAFAAAKRALSSSLLAADELLLLLARNAAALSRDDKLLLAYKDCVTSHCERLRAKDRNAASFELSTNKHPSTEELAEDLLPKWVDAAKELKDLKAAFLKDTLHMQTALRAKMMEFKQAAEQTA